MTNFDPSVSVAQVIYPRPVTGFRRLVQVNHPVFGMVTLLSTDVSLNDSGSPNFTKYVLAPYESVLGQGPMQKMIHTAGTREISWTVSGDITGASLGLLGLLAGSARGVNCRQLLISQGQADIEVDGQNFHPPSFLFDNQDGNSLPWSQFSLSGNQNAALTFSLEGKATVDPSLAVGPLVPVFVSSPVPTWMTGNDLVLSWSLSHNVNLQPFWFNDPKQWLLSNGITKNVDSMLPSYYRALDSEFTLQLTTAVALSPYTLVRIGYGYVNLAQMVVTSANITFGDRNSVVNYQVSSTNAGVQYQASSAAQFDYSAPLPPSSIPYTVPLPQYTEFVDIFLNGVPDASYG